jgi:hypothetical protein
MAKRYQRVQIALIGPFLRQRWRHRRIQDSESNTGALAHQSLVTGWPVRPVKITPLNAP